jgi:hypothetical protein
MTFYHVRQRGVAAVEFALLLPLLLIMLFGMIDAARALQANTIMVNIGREGANLVSRGNVDLSSGSQDVMYALMASAPPLNVNKQGMIYITRVMGVVTNGVSKSVVLDQYRWDDAARGLGFRSSAYAPGSRAYTCGSWSNGACTGISSTSRPTTTIMSGQLDDGEIVFVVETWYRYDMLITGAATKLLGLPVLGPNLYSMTIF